jgi:hypothetical protein
VSLFEMYDLLTATPAIVCQLYATPNQEGEGK